VLALALASLRLRPAPSPSPDAAALAARASRAFAEKRWEDAAELARHALDRLRGPEPRRAELLCLRGEALLDAGHAREAAAVFSTVLESGGGALRSRALYWGARARAAAGEPAVAEALRRQLRSMHAGSPWVERLGRGH
jgi:predicted Zn-dependent protease